MLSHNFYDRRASEWSAADIQQLVGAEENLHLEYKKPSEFIRNQTFSRDEFSRQLTETVSAFLNSDGGVILIGVQTDKFPGDRKVELLKSIDDWSEVQTFEHLGITLSVSQIRDSIYANILPKPLGIEVHPLKITFNQNVTTLFIVAVQKSPIGAHQSVITRCYYRRTSDSDMPMYDFEIRDVNNRRAGPFLYLECAVRNADGMYGDENWSHLTTKVENVEANGKAYIQVTLLYTVSNSGHGTANIAKLDIGIPKPWILHQYSPTGINIGAHWAPMNSLASLIGDRVTVFWDSTKCTDLHLKHICKPPVMQQAINWQAVVYNGNQLPAYPIWPSSGRVLLGELELRLQKSNGSETRWWLPWRILAENMPEIRGSVYITNHADTLVLYNFQIDDVNWWGYAEELFKFDELKQRFQV